MSSNPSQVTRHYTALNAATQQIRLLNIAPGDKAERVRCELRTVSLVDTQTPPYETISYCWGSPEAEPCILLDGNLVAVPPNAEAAIRRMRYKDRPRILWIDAVCINQNFLTERSQQVSLMTTIYRRASKNLVYLGEDDGSAEAALGAIGCVVKDMKAATDDLRNLADALYDAKSAASRYCAQGFDETVDFNALGVLFSLPWFCRLWVLQEAVLAQSSTCHWGNYECSLLDIAGAARWLSYKYHFISSAVYTCAGWSCASNMFDLLFGKHQPLLTSMVNISRRFEKTDPKDSVYAILGLIHRKSSEIEQQGRLLRVDYARPLAEILRDATRFALSQTGDLIAMRSLDHSEDQPLRDSCTSWTMRIDIQRKAGYGNRIQKFFKACRGLELPGRLLDTSHGENILLCEGITIDHVSQTTDVCEGKTWGEYEALYEWLVTAKQLLQNIGDGHVQDGPAPTMETMAFVLRAGETYNKTRACAEDLFMLTELLGGIARHQDEFRDISYEGGNPRRLPRIRICQGRRFFVTQRGFAGLGPRTMTPNDAVVVLRGGLWPFIIRQVDGHHQLVGPAYVHGIMDGEAVSDHFAKGGKEQVFAFH